MADASLSLIIIIFGLILSAGIITLILLFLRRPQSGGSTELGALMERLSGLTEQNKDLRRVLDEKLSETHAANTRHLGETAKLIQSISGQSAKLITDVTEKLTKLDETNKQVVNFSSQLQSLQDILKNPKQRGVLGEYYLETLLKNCLPPTSYQMQYAFKNNVIVDAVVFIKNQVVPIDSKFSLENYNRILEAPTKTERDRLEKVFLNDLKTRIVETSKYIQPDQGTTEFAFMFIPHEAIYYDLLINKIGAITEETENLLQRAASKYKVIIVSPTSFLAYLQTVLQGLKAMQIEENAKSIITSVGKLTQHIATYDTYFKKVGASLSTTVNHYNAAQKELQKVDKDIVKIAGSGPGVDTLLVDRPTLEIE